jgi:hypothetical protein
MVAYTSVYVVSCSTGGLRPITQGTAALHQIISTNHSHFNAVNVATAMHRLAVRFTDVAPSVATELLVKAAIAMLPVCKPRELSTIAHTTAKLGTGVGSFLGSPLFCSMLMTALTDRAAELDPQGIANSIHALATITKQHNEEEDGSSGGGVPSGLAAAAVALAKASTAAAASQRPQELANTCWAVATLRVETAVVMNALATAVLQFITPGAGGRIGRFTPQGLSMVVSLDHH